MSLNINRSIINNNMYTYDITTDTGFRIHMCLCNGVTYILIDDIYTDLFQMRFFTNVEPALEFIRKF
jgi:hypothetical protein